MPGFRRLPSHGGFGCVGPGFDEVRESRCAGPGGGGGDPGRLGAHLPALAGRPRRVAEARRWTKWRGCLSCSDASPPSTSTRSWWRSRLQAQLQLGAVDLAGLWAQAGAQARRSPAQAPAPCAPRHDGTPDGSRHEWLPGQPALDLMVTMDDATSEIYSAFFVEEEGTMSSLRAPGDRGARPGQPLLAHGPAARWTRTTRPRSGARFSASASSSSQPIRPPGGGPSACSAPCRSAAGTSASPGRAVYLPQHNARFGHPGRGRRLGLRLLRRRVDAYDRLEPTPSRCQVACQGHGPPNRCLARARWESTRQAACRRIRRRCRYLQADQDGDPVGPARGWPGARMRPLEA